MLRFAGSKEESVEVSFIMSNLEAKSRQNLVKKKNTYQMNKIHIFGFKVVIVLLSQEEYKIRPQDCFRL